MPSSLRSRLLSGEIVRFKRGGAAMSSTTDATFPKRGYLSARGAWQRSNTRHTLLSRWQGRRAGSGPQRTPVIRNIRRAVCAWPCQNVTLALTLVIYGHRPPPPSDGLQTLRSDIHMGFFFFPLSAAPHGPVVLFLC